jgi:hypothetical protein
MLNRGQKCVDMLESSTRSIRSIDHQVFTNLTKSGNQSYHLEPLRQSCLVPKIVSSNMFVQSLQPTMYNAAPV